MSADTPTAELQRVFELYVERLVDELRGDAQAADEVLVLRLAWFGENITQTISRLGTNPEAAQALVHRLSSLMQEIDSLAGASEQAHQTMQFARRWALVLPGGEGDVARAATQGGGKAK